MIIKASSQCVSILLNTVISGKIVSFGGFGCPSWWTTRPVHATVCHSWYQVTHPSGVPVCVGVYCLYMMCLVCKACSLCIPSGVCVQVSENTLCVSHLSPVLSVSLCLLFSSQPEQPSYFSIRLITLWVSARPNVYFRLFRGQSDTPLINRFLWSRRR